MLPKSVFAIRHARHCLAASLIFAAGCGVKPGSGPAPVVTAPPAEATSAAEVPRRKLTDGTMRIGLVSQSGGATCDLKLPSGGKLLNPDKPGSAVTLDAGAQVCLALDETKHAVRAAYGKQQLTGGRLVLRGPLIRLGKGRFPTELEVTARNGGLQFVNVLDIEQYLEGVLPGELPRNFHIEAQKALAVAARSYALVQRGKHGDFDLCDRTCCQMYLGLHQGSPRGLAAVRATRRQTLWHKKELAYTFYSADCGGVSTNVEEVPLRDKPEGALPYLTVVRDAPSSGKLYCRTSPFHEWSKRFTRDQLETKLNARPETEVGKLVKLEMLDYDPSGRVRSVRLVGEMPQPGITRAGFGGASGSANQGSAVRVEKIVSGWEFRRSVGALALKSTKLRMDQPRPDVYRFIGHGFGHGLGLCQIGANGMAKSGAGYRKILAHYYPGTRVEILPPSTAKL